MKDIKVAVLTEIPTPYRDPLFERLSQQKGWNITILYCSETEYGRDWNFNDCKNYRYEILPGIKWTFKGEMPFSFKINSAIWSRLSYGNYDAVVIGGYTHVTMQLAILWCWLHKIPYIIMSETHLLNPRGRVKKILKELIVRPIVSKATAYLPTGTLSKRYLTYYGGDPDKMFFFPNTPDIERLGRESKEYKKRKEYIKKEMSITKELVILYVGRLMGVKGLRYLLKAFWKLENQREDVTLLIVGDGDLREDLEEVVKKDNIRNVHFIGFVEPEELAKFYAISDIFVLPSTSERWGVVINEAMACGLPVIATRMVGASNDLIKDGVNGFIVLERNVEELYKTMKKIVEDELLREKMHENSFKVIRDWDYERCIRSFKRAVRVALEE